MEEGITIPSRLVEMNDGSEEEEVDLRRTVQKDGAGNEEAVDMNADPDEITEQPDDQTPLDESDEEVEDMTLNRDPRKPLRYVVMRKCLYSFQCKQELKKSDQHIERLNRRDNKTASDPICHQVCWWNKQVLYALPYCQRLHHHRSDRCLHVAERDGASTAVPVQISQPVLR
eukprot:TRINITY_DN10082_c0_g1_i1.p1 TRINITY_DN10082_c0_g1~~TRINITY_DN10082_c0_g1_i1.p1  ORF type:complete len:180 (-),score=9.63 TRINITY_DN10082_c0_g1_i1:44-559(-)